MDTTQELSQTDGERFDSLPPVLIRYAEELEQRGQPMDSGLPEILRFVAQQIVRQVNIEEAGESPRKAIAKAETRDMEVNR